MAASVWRGRITFGLVSIPVRLVKAARRERIRFRRVQRVQATEMEDDVEIPEPPPHSARVVEFPRSPKGAPAPPPAAAPPPPVEQVERVRNAPMMRGEVLKGYEIARDEFVPLAPQEVAALRPRTSTDLEISEFVPVDKIDPLYYETSYFVVPDPGGEKAYALLFATLKVTGHAGMGSLAMHGREHVVLIRAGQDALVLHSMFYANEVGRAPYRVEAGETNAKQLELAKMLVGALEAKFEPEKWTDHYEERLKALIESRTPVPAARAPEAGPAQAPEVDIMEALRQSLEMKRKPVAKEEQPTKPKRRPAKEK